jgi:hypothetical protein
LKKSKDVEESEAESAVAMAKGFLTAVSGLI